MRHSTGKYALIFVMAGLSTSALEPRPLQGGQAEQSTEAGYLSARAVGTKPLPVPIEQEEYLEADDWFQAGVTLNSEGRYREAAEAFNKSIAISPSNALSWLNLGTAQALTGDYTRAIDSLKKSVRLDPKLALGFSNLGEVCFRADRYEEAIEAYTMLLSLWPNNTNALYKLGLSHLFLNDTGKAQAQYLSLKLIDPELAEKLRHAIIQGASD